jgi:hypothetical protein
MVTLDPPVLVTVSDSVCEFPTWTLPKLRLVGFADSVPGEVPVPERGTVNVGLGALEVTVRLPVAFPAANGANVMVRPVLCPAASVAGTDRPLKLNPVPLTWACEIVTLLPPVLVRVDDTGWLVPTATLPKATLVGVTVSEPGASAAPESGRFKVGFEALLVNVTLPVPVPAAVGVKTTLNAVL